MTNPYLSDIGSISISGNIVSSYISNFSETGGDLTGTTIPTMGRRQSRNRYSTKNPYEVTFDFSAQDTTFGTTLSLGSSISGAVFKVYESNPSITITYGAGYIKGLNYDQSADDRLKGNIVLEFSPYNKSGTDNRVIS